MAITLDGTTGITTPGLTGLTTPVPVASGGTGAATATAYAVQCGGTTTTGAHQSIASVGTSGQVLTSNGAAALPTFQTVSSSPIATMDVKTTGTSATWTIPTGITKVRITVVGGGGNGNGNAGGGGGGTAIKVLTSLTPGNTLLYTVGGAQATSQVASGTQTITTVSATGGAAPTGDGSGGFGGIGSNGDLNMAGGGGTSLDEAINTRLWGTGGCSFFGGGGAGQASASSSNNPGRAYGGGGAAAGGGAAGVIVFEY